ncbi:ser/thr kinase (Cop-B1R) [Choristoneura rosaceana entomopoxvirus 'L']|uniref:Ser/thr kinase (Cop-B1R) n=1 Tax=Choristoneura rosaceana entomopoxvirus 'L' TaxID=1293539 RepID=A0ABM9QKE5_9POXV|nr:ser/thr kinase (Cop-B1R) [Choristoneura rosaceana entomopoxvirus 'L']CCU56011.1 ser/thr kinase (Cop-B1R) [Choristoneura rosaceana entomopoxvirus 'L']
MHPYNNIIYECHINDGSFGQVHKFKMGSKTLAIKFFKNNIYFKHELDVLKYIKNNIYKNDNNANICFLNYYHEAKNENNLSYIAFNYYDYDLLTYKNNFALNDSDILEICLQICNGLKYLHKIKIVHCDLKPENILCGYKEGRLNIGITDFGLSYYENQIITNEIVTSYYRSPELIYAIKNKLILIKPSIDMWSFGIIIYYLKYNDVLPNNIYRIEEYIKNNPIKQMQNIESIINRLLQYEQNRYNSSDIYIELKYLQSHNLCIVL